jgi:Tfp pilus assembly protein PilO
VTARDRNILLVIAALAALAGFWFVGVRPKHAESKALSSRLAEQQTRLQSAQSALGAGRAAKTSYAQDAATVAQLGKAIPADEDIPSLLFELQSASHNAKVTFDSIQRAAPNTPSGSGTSGTTGATSAASLPPGTTVGTAGLVTAPFTLKFSGSYFDLQRFVDDVQHFVRTKGDTVAVNGRLLTIDGVALTVGGGDLKKLDAQIVATAYLSPSTPNSSSASPAGSSSTTPGATGPTASTATTSNAIPAGQNR